MINTSPAQQPRPAAAPAAPAASKPAPAAAPTGRGQGQLRLPGGMLGCVIKAISLKEASIVVRRGEAAHLPEVHSLINANGQPMPQAVPRDTAQTAHKVTEALPRGRLSQRLNRRALFAQPAAA